MGVVSRHRSSGGEEHVGVESGEWRAGLICFGFCIWFCSWVFGAWKWRVGRHLEKVKKGKEEQESRSVLDSSSMST